MRVAMPRFGELVAPCFGYSATITVFTIRRGKVVEQVDFCLQSTDVLDRVRLMRDQNVGTLICGGLEERLEDMLLTDGVHVIAWVSGRVDDQEVKITGAGGYRAGELTCSSAKAALSGTGSITLNVEETLDATITGAGSIRYHGEPTVFQRITGVGSVRSLDRGSA